MEYILESSWPDRKPEAEEWPEKKKKKPIMPSQKVRHRDPGEPLSSLMKAKPKCLPQTIHS